MQDTQNKPVIPRDWEGLSSSEINNVITTIFEKQTNKISTLTKELNWFKEQFKLLKHSHYGKTSEQQSQLNLSLFDEDAEVLEEESIPDKISVSYDRKKSNRSPKNIDTSNLPREKRYIDLSETDKQCSCGRCRERFGEDSHEELVFQPASLKVIEHIRYKYTCRHCENVKAPAVVDMPLSKSKAGASLLAEVILNKYRYHLPFYRQSKIFSNHGIKIPDNTMGGWVMQVSEKLEPLQTALWQQLSQVKLLQADETPVKVLDPGKKGYMWLYHSYLPDQRFVIFDFNLSRSSTVVNERLQDFKGILQTDGYSGYATQRKRADIISLGCWDHARRKFTDVVKVSGNNKSGKAGMMLKKIASLYAIEKEIKSLSFAERHTIRQQDSKQKLELIYELLHKINAPPKSLLGTAVTYCKNQWGELTRYIDHGETQISNCWVENQVRPFAVGRRNWLFMGNEKSASKAALLYSLIQSCELNSINPRAYLTYVINQIHPMRRGEVKPTSLLPHTIDKALLVEKLDSS